MKINKFFKYLKGIRSCILLCLLLPFTVRAQGNKALTDSLLAILPHAKDTVKVLILNQLAAQFVFTDTPKSRTWAQEALQLSQTKDYRKGEAEASCHLCMTLGMQGQYAQALQHCQNAKDLYAKLKNQAGIATAYNNTGLVLNQQARYPEALENFLYALSIRQKLQDRKAIALMTENIGMIYFRQEDYQEALRYFEESRRIHQNMDNQTLETKVLVNIGATYNRLKNYPKALACHSEVLIFFEKTNNLTGAGIACNNLGNVHLETKNYEEALKYYRKSLLIKEKQKDKRGTAVTLKNIAETYLNKGDLKEAKLHIDQSLKIAEEIGAKEQIRDAYDILAQMYEKTQDFEKALEYEKKASLAKDSLFSSDKTEQIARMRTIYETEKAQREKKIALQKAQIAEKNILLEKERSQLSRILNYVTFSAIISGFLFAWLFINRIRLKTQKLAAENRAKEQENLRLQEEMQAEAEINKIEQEKLQAELDFKNRELTSNTLYLVQKNEVLLTLKEELEQMIPDTDAGLKPKLRSLQRSLNHSLEVEKDWESFRLHFEQVHPTFFANLQAKYPDLTPHEIKLCAYLRLNLTTKEIANLTNNTVRGVETARYRLRKKLGIEAEENLTELLLRFS
jgi:tetratricopeptide (TPR) repeat protein/DNA-binding CsgD family transcriptional regulator